MLKELFYTIILFSWSNYPADLCSYQSKFASLRQIATFLFSIFQGVVEVQNNGHTGQFETPFEIKSPKQSQPTCFL